MTSLNDNILDLHDNSMSNLKWALNQPNEGETQKCISSYICIINDIECDMMNCLACQIPEKKHVYF